MLASVSGTTAITLFDASAMDTRIAAEVKSFALHPLVPDKFRRLLSRSSSFGLNASIEAVLDAGLRIGDEDDEPDADLGIAMGCGLIYPELEEFIEIFEDYFGRGLRPASYRKAIPVISVMIWSSQVICLRLGKYSRSGSQTTCNTSATPVRLRALGMGACC